MKQEKTCLLSVIPLVHIAPSRGHIFSYTFSSPIPIGTLVEIPLGKTRIVLGIVVTSKITTISQKGLKSIKKIVSPSLLAEKHIAFAEYIAREYFGSVGTILDLFRPPKIKKVKSQKSLKNESIESIQLTPKQKNAVKKIAQTKNPILLTGPPASGKTEVLIEVVKRVLQEGKQVLFLLPEITLTPHSVDRMTRRLGSGCVSVFHSALTKGQRASVWHGIASGRSQVVIGSRSALFLPFQNLGLVIVDEENDDSYKQTLKSPRYDTRIVAEKLAKIHQARTIFCSSTPRSETLFRVDHKTLDIVDLPILEMKKSLSPPQIQIVDMRLAHWKNKQKKMSPPIFSEDLIERIRETLKRKEQILLLVSRQGMNAFSLCTVCKNILRCPKCDRALVGQHSGHYLCLGGHFRTQAFPKCPTCGGLQFTSHGVGTQKVEEELVRLFPYSRIARFDSQVAQKRSLRESLFSDMSDRKIDILIGTQMIAKGWDISHLSLIGIIDSDSFFSIPDYSTDARIAQLLFQARGRLNRVGSISSGALLIQTYHSERPIFSFLEKNNYTGFITEEMETRQALKYPPYCRLLRLVGKSTNDIKLRAQALDLYKEMASIKDPDLVIARPTKSLKRQKMGIFSRQIVIKHFSQQISPPIRKILENIPKNWYIDNDAVSIA